MQRVSQRPELTVHFLFLVLFLFSYAHSLTDYVFDGTSPPYTPSARTNPLNLYGRTKRDGELAVLGVPGAKAVVLRVPVLCVPLPVFPAHARSMYQY